MRDQLKFQESMDIDLDCMAEESRQLCSQSQVDGVMIAALSSQLQGVRSHGDQWEGCRK